MIYKRMNTDKDLNSVALAQIFTQALTLKKHWF